MAVQQPATPAPIPPKPAAPELVPPPTRRRTRTPWLVAAFLAVAGGIGLLIWNDHAAQLFTSGGGPGGVVVRTAAVAQGRVEKTLRLTGTTGAERFAMLTAPRMRGSRSDFGRSGPSGSFTRSGGATGGRSGDGGGGRGPGGGPGLMMIQAATMTASADPSGGANASASITAAIVASGFGLTLQRLVPPGTHVKAGDVVAAFDTEDMLQRLDDYDASLAQSKASYEKMLADVAVDREALDQTLENAQADRDKAQLDLKSIPVLSAIDAENAKLTAQETQAALDQVKKGVPEAEIGIDSDLKSADLELRQTGIERDRAQANVEKMELKAPMDGIVVMENIMRGNEFDRIKAGDQLAPGQNILQVVDTSSMVVNATVNQSDSEQIKIGQRAQVHFDGFPDLILPAHVQSIGAIGEAGQYRPDWVKEIPVKLKLEKTDPRVTPDLSVSADVIIQSSPSEVLIPSEALFHDTEGSSPYVFVKVADGWEQRNVEVDLADNVRTAVRSGLKPGETVALQRPSSKSQIRSVVKRSTI